MRVRYWGGGVVGRRVGADDAKGGMVEWWVGGVVGRQPVRIDKVNPWLKSARIKPKATLSRVTGLIGPTSTASALGHLIRPASVLTGSPVLLGRRIIGEATAP